MLTYDTKAFVCVVGFEPFLMLLLESHSSAILVLSLAERWWDTIHTFHIAEMEMIVTPYDFHQMTSLRCDGSLINLEGESSIQLGIDLLGQRHMIETVRYFDLEMDHKPLPWEMPKDCTRMARVFLLYILRAFLFTNDGQMMSLRWLAFFRDFGEAREANWSQACHAYLYSSLDTLNWGTLHQLVEPWKLLEVSSFFLFFSSFLLTCTLCLCNVIQVYKAASHAFANCAYVFILQTIILQLSFISLKTVIYFLANYYLANSHIANFHLANCHLANCYPATCHLLNCAFSFQRWIVKYVLIARGEEVNLRSTTSIRAHFDGLSSNEVSKDPTFFCMFPRVLLLSQWVVIGHMDSLGRCSSYCGPCFGSGCPCYFWDHSTFGGCWSEGPLLS